MNKDTFTLRPALAAAGAFLAAVIFFSHPSVAAAGESTAHIDLKMILEDNRRDFYSERQDLLLDILRTMINQVPEGSESEDVAKWVQDFTEKGFIKGSSGEFLFADANAQLCEKFLGIVQESGCRLDRNFLRRIYERCQAGPEVIEFKYFLEPAWLNFSSNLADEETYQALSGLLDRMSGAGKMREYLMLLYYGYKTHGKHETDFDGRIDGGLLGSPSLRAEDIKDLYGVLKQDYWGSFQIKRDWMLEKAAWRLFNDFSPQDWAGKIEPSIALDLASILTMAGKTNDHDRISLVDWFKKMGACIKKSPADIPVRSLLTYFISNSGLSLRESFQALREFFADDQRMFTALHESPPDSSAMGIWNKDKENAAECMTLLDGFFQIGSAGEWDVGLWDCLRDYYYVPRPTQVRERLFNTIIKPIYESRELAANPVRKRMLREAEESKSFMLESHRYEIAHHLLTTSPMTDMAAIENKDSDTLSFAIQVFNNLAPESAELYDSDSLKKAIKSSGETMPQDKPERILRYVNFVLSEPLLLMCYAFMGKTDLTGGVAFSLDNEAQVRQFEAVLRRIVQIKGDLMQNYGRSLGRVKALEKIAEEIISKMEDAIQRKDTKQIVNLIRLTLKITVILEDDSYIDRILLSLRKDVFGVGDDPYLFVQLSGADLDAKAGYFHLLCSDDLVSALRAVGKRKYFEKFYRMLYMPLRSIYGFFNKVGAEPYLKFVSEFTEGKYDTPEDVDMNGLFDAEVESLGSIHDETGRPKYIDAEEAIASFIAGPNFEKLGIKSWNDPHRINMNKNVNLGVLYRLLNKTKVNDWAMAECPDNTRAKNYRQVAEVFIENMENPDRMDKPVSLSGQPELYSKWDFFVFVRSLVDLYEIYGYPLPVTASSSTMFTGAPEGGIKRDPLIGNINDVATRKLDGTLRASVIEKFVGAPEASQTAGSGRSEMLGETTLLLPNSDDNNAGEKTELDRYWVLKEGLFKRISSSLDDAAASADKLRRLILLCRMETSVYGLDNEKAGFGYERVRSKYMAPLGKVDQTTLRLEEFRLKEVNQPNGREANTVLELAPVVQQLVDVLSKDYDLMRVLTKGKADSVSQAILALYKAANPNNILEELKDDHVETLWFLTTRCRNALADSAGRLESLSQEEKAATAGIMSSLFVIYSYFMPYIDSGFNVGAIFDVKNALPVFCMLNYDIKAPATKLLGVYESSWSGIKGAVRMRPFELETFLICHNFLPIYLLEAGLNDSTRFLKLVEGRQISVRVYNFRLLWEREDRATVSMEHLCGEIMGGMENNKNILTASAELTDDVYLEYFFGDMRRVLNKKPKFETQMPQNFDSVVQRLAVLPEDDRVVRLKSDLERKISELAGSAQSEESDKRKKRFEEALNDVSGLKGKVDAVLDKRYEYFGKVLAKQFRSVFTIQKACEEAVEHVNRRSPRQMFKAMVQPADEYASSRLSAEVWRRYNKFYEAALFDEKGGFARELEERMVRLFYEPPKNNERKADYKRSRLVKFAQFLDGGEIKDEPAKLKVTTAGFAACANKSADTRSAVDSKYIEAGARFLKCLFCGEYMERGYPFIGDIVWDKDEKGRITVKPLPYDDKTGEEETRDLLKWIFDCGEKYGNIPELRKLFLRQDVVMGKPQPEPAAQTVQNTEKDEAVV
ncbi:MAG: hypothetical protein Q8N91_04375 [Candidatus Omnitrophota bacterium]|nr:hypothetical protein [Candidatus Omnitrophota bacterium]